MTEVLDLLFIHVPTFHNHYRPYGEYMSINLLPMGTLALADLVNQRGYRTMIVHLGLEWIEHGDFSPFPFLKGKEVTAVAMPLHWHQQSYEVMKVAQELKARDSSPYIVLGGYTASLFHQEILDNFPQIDAVIRGDAEGPLMALMNALTQRGRMEAVPNLTWRNGDGIMENPMRYVATEKGLDDASYANLQLLKGNDTYIRYMGIPFVWAKGLSKEDNQRHLHLGRPMLPLTIGRGCTGDCSWCGGGARAQRLINGRRGVVFRAPEKVADTISEAQEVGYEMMHIAFDPGAEAEQYYRGLFPLLKEKGIRVRCYFESFSLPSEAFLLEFAEAFDLDGSVIALSPESGDERIRYRNKTFSYSNEELFRAIALAERLGIRVDIFFAMGIPGERYPDLAKTAALRREIRRRFTNIGRVWTSPISLEPASPWHLNPEEFGIVATRRSFVDFYQGSSPGQRGLGYFIPDYLSNGGELNAPEFEKLMRDTKCRDHCSLHPNPSKASSPFWGRLYCRYLSRRQGGVSG